MVVLVLLQQPHFNSSTWTLGLLDTWTFGLLDAYWTLGLLDSWTLIGLLDSWTLIGLLDSWTPGLLDSWTLGHLVAAAYILLVELEVVGEFRTCIDLSRAYEQVPVDDPLSRKIMAVVTPLGYAVPKTLMFGVKTAPAIFN